MTNVDLSKYTNEFYHPGSKIKIFIWMIISFVFFEHSLAIFSKFKCFLLRLFGSKIGSGCIIKPGCKIKYPWFLTVYDNVWLGENTWIDNLENILIESNCCISQGAYLFTGNHDYKKQGFDLITKPVMLRSGSWVGAKAVVCPGVELGEFSILTAGSIANSSLEPFGIYQGNPATLKRKRSFI